MGSLGCGQDPLSVPEARCSRWGYTWEHQVVDAAPVLRPVELEPGPLLLDDAPVVREAVDLRRAREHAPLALAPALFDGPVDAGREIIL